MKTDCGAITSHMYLNKDSSCEFHFSSNFLDYFNL